LVFLWCRVTRHRVSRHRITQHRARPAVLRLRGRPAELTAARGRRPPFAHADGTSGTSETSSFHPRDTHPCKVVTCGNAWSPMCPPCQPDLVPLVPLNPVSAGQTFHTTPRVGSTLVPPAWNEVKPAPRSGSTLVPFPPVSAGQTFHPGSIGKDPSRHVGGRGAGAPRHKKRGPPTTTASPSNATNDPRLPTTRPLREPPTRAPRAP
jgi:hypothetical protein